MDETGQFTLEDDALCDFYCPTAVTMHTVDGHLNPHCSHYFRITGQGCYPEYRLLIPPFELIWLDGRNNLKIYDNSNWKSYDEPWRYFDQIALPEVVRKAKQLHKFRAFL